MKYVFFDVETTAILSCYITQLAYLVEENGVLRAENFYFSVPEISKTSESLTGLSVPLLKILSGGKTFADCAEKILSDVRDAVLAAHGAQLDVSHLSAEAERAGARMTYYETLCTRKLFRKIMNRKKNPPLVETASYSGIGNEEIAAFARKIFAQPEGAPQFALHNAAYDAAAVYLAVNAHRKEFEVMLAAKRAGGIARRSQL